METELYRNITTVVRLVHCVLRRTALYPGGDGGGLAPAGVRHGLPQLQHAAPGHWEHGLSLPQTACQEQMQPQGLPQPRQSVSI